MYHSIEMWTLVNLPAILTFPMQSYINKVIDVTPEHTTAKLAYGDTLIST